MKIKETIINVTKNNAKAIIAGAVGLIVGATIATIKGRSSNDDCEEYECGDTYMDEINETNETYETNEE